METFEIAWFSSAFIVAFLVYTLEPFEPRGIPIQANGRTIRVPDKFADNMSEISAFAAEFELALKKAVPDLKAASGSLWTARLIRGKRPEVEKALQGMDDLRREHSALLDRAVHAYDHGEVIGAGLKEYRKKQRVKMDQVQELMKEHWPRRSSWTLV